MGYNQRSAATSGISPIGITSDIIRRNLELPCSSMKTVPATRVQAIRLALDARKWVASRLLPKRYGDHAQLDLGVSGVPVNFQAIAERARAARRDLE